MNTSADTDRRLKEIDLLYRRQFLILFKRQFPSINKSNYTPLFDLLSRKGHSHIDQSPKIQSLYALDKNSVNVFKEILALWRYSIMHDLESSHFEVDSLKEIANSKTRKLEQVIPMIDQAGSKSCIDIYLDAYGDGALAEDIMA